MEDGEFLNDAELKKFKEDLSEEIKRAIYRKKEFSFLEEFCKEYEVKFNEGIINDCLDSYLRFKKEGDSNFKAKYVAMFKTACEMIFY